jgi:quercetin 2,3-dioxygenase
VRPFHGSVHVELPDGTTALDSGQLAVIEGDGAVNLVAGEAGAGMLLLSGLPLGEPIVQHGPFVMNTVQEIREAIRDYQSGALVAPSAGA